MLLRMVLVFFLDFVNILKPETFQITFQLWTEPKFDMSRDLENVRNDLQLLQQLLSSLSGILRHF